MDIQNFGEVFTAKLGQEGEPGGKSAACSPVEAPDSLDLRVSEDEPFEFFRNDPMSFSREGRLKNGLGENNISKTTQAKDESFHVATFSLRSF